MKKIVFKAYVDGVEVADTGDYSFDHVRNQVEDLEHSEIAEDLMNRVRDYYSEPAEHMFAEDYQR